MKEVTHFTFTLGVLLAVSYYAGRFFIPPSYSYAYFLLPLWLAFAVNELIDRGFGHVMKDVGGEMLPVRSWITHDVRTAPLWGIFAGSGTIALLWALQHYLYSRTLPPIETLPVYPLVWAGILGVIAAYSHLFFDAFTEAGVFWKRRRVAIAHWRYNNYLANMLFIAVGVILALTFFAYLSLPASL